MMAYLRLEHEMLVLDTLGDPLADVLRDAMDPLWLGLNNEEHALLDARVIVDESSSLINARDAFFSVSSDPVVMTERYEPLTTMNWECEAA